MPKNDEHSTHNETKGNPLPQTLEKVTLFAPDINCGHCESTIRQEVGALAGVQSVTPSATTKLVEVEYDPSQVAPTQMIAAMTQAGYPAKEWVSRN
jgi:copper chaperone CopZ